MRRCSPNRRKREVGWRREKRQNNDFRQIPLTDLMFTTGDTNGSRVTRLICVLMAEVSVPHPFLCLIYLEGFGDLWNRKGWKGSVTSVPDASLMRTAHMHVHVHVLVNTQEVGGGEFAVVLTCNVLSKRSGCTYMAAQTLKFVKWKCMSCTENLNNHVGGFNLHLW